MKLLPVHPLADLLPPMSDADFAALLADIDANGQRDPVELFGGKIIDGRHRDRAMVKLGRKTKTIEFKGTEAQAFSLVRSRAIRRNMTTGQKVWAAVNCLPHFKAEAAARKAANGGDKKSDPKKVKGPVKQASDKGQGEAAAVAARAFGISAPLVYQGEKIRIADAREFAKLASGESTLAQSRRAVEGKIKRKRLIDSAALSLAACEEHTEIITWDCIKHMQTMPRGKVRLVFADPMYNIDYSYGPGKRRDKMTPEKYLAFTRAWIEEARGILTPDGSLWVMICDEWAAEYGCILKAAGFTIRRWIKWYETFGANCRDNFNRCTRHLFYCVVDPDRFIFNHAAFNRQSERQRIGDKRAAAGGKLWDDTWQIPRLVDNAKERVIKGATQLPLALVRPIVEGCSEAGDTVFDPFTGTGTTAVAAVTTGRKFIGTEIEKEFADLARTRVRAEGATFLLPSGACGTGVIQRAAG